MEAAIFDLDGTIIDTIDDLVELTNHVLIEYDMPTHSKDAIQRFVGNGALALMNQAVPEGTPSEITQEALARWKELNPHFLAHSHPYPGISETLNMLKSNGVRIAVLSNKFDAGVSAMIEAKLPNTFDIIRGERPDTPRKPDPTGLLSIIEQLGATPESCIYVGDSPGDILTALNAGCMAVGVSWGYRYVDEIQKAGANIIINKPEELISLCIPNVNGE